jgi:hypothetical protein
MTLPSKNRRMRSLLRQPGAWVPIGISLFCLGMVGYRVARFGLVVEADEGTEAHLFQILMPVQLVILVLFAARWWGERPRETLRVLVVQLFLVLAAFGAVFLMERLAASRAEAAPDHGDRLPAQHNPLAPVFHPNQAAPGRSLVSHQLLPPDSLGPEGRQGTVG